MAHHLEHQLADGTAILGAGIAAGAKPVLQQPVGGLGGAGQRLQNLDGHLQAGGWGHLPDIA